MTDEKMDVDEQVKRLNAALRLQGRSALQYTLTGGSLLGLQYQLLAERFGDFARHEIDDARRLVEKVAALGGEPTAEVAPPRFHTEAKPALQWLVESETEALTALQDAIEPTGREAASEAVEHRLEHMIMRKQEQVDVLLRALRG
ncbi:MAG TPA: ferritin-like domain-containing protein [Thermoleophilaceae bacterium]|nr:ferritin-like domain-containing protein [Thermoleophilaceae bacterium]